MNKDMKYYYIYLIKFETGEVYVGSRQSKVPPEQDTKYWGSPVTYKHLWEDVNLKKEKFIIKECKSVEELREIEPKLIKAGWEKYGDKCLNRNASPVFHPEVCRETGRKNGKKVKELGLGIHALSKEERSTNGKKFGPIGGKISKENNLGIFGLSKEERSKNGKIGGKIGGKISGGNKNAMEKCTKTFIFKSPNGEIVKGKNITKFCRDNNLNRRSLYSVIAGKHKHHKGWTLP